MKQNQQNDKSKPRIITLKQFLRHFGEQRNRKFCFILGAGASKSSGIPTGTELASQWLNEIKEDLDKGHFESWLREEGINKNAPASFYHQIFAKRFEIDHQAGYDFFEEIMEKAEPSCGYSFLAEILAQGKHDIVITTNFDSLTEDALFIYTSKKPLVIGHADLAGFINIQLQRPQVIKVHHDLFFSPQNTEDETGHIDEKLERGLQDIFQSYIPIVIGYGGNDGGFMDVLKRVLYKHKGIYWCFTGKEHPKGKIEKLVVDKQGCFIPIKDFDELMVLLGEKIGIGLPDEKIERIAEERVKRYRKQMKEVYIKNKEGSDLLPDALDKILKLEKLGEPNWLTYGFLASKETDPEKIESVYKEGLEKCPDSYELMNDYAIFLENTKKDYARAEKYYQKALALDPDDATINRNYAELLTYYRKDYVQAEEYYQKALALDPDDADINSHYAIFLQDFKKDYAQAEKYHQKALKLDPDNATINSDYAIFLTNPKKDYAQAEKYHQKALKLDPDDATINRNYAELLTYYRKDYVQAEEYYQKALALDPDDADINSHYAIFLQDFKKDYAQAEKYHQKSLALDSDDATINRCYALFLAFVKRDYAQAEEYYRKSLKLDPDDADINSHYAIFLQDIKRDYAQAQVYHKKALELDPDDAYINSDYALFLALIKRDYAQAQVYHEKALALDPDDADINSDYTIFLQDIKNNKRDYTQAQVYHEKALELKPNDANINGNYALFLLQQGYFEQAKTFIDQAFLLHPLKNLELELWFYRYACFYQDYPESKSKVESLLQDGIRSPGWPLEGLLEIVKKIVQHPEYDQVAEFARQISEV
ncbi:MAG: tetratricopeptide repeat protein [Gemmatimonadetes bacterium]|nr:tetratricopeptide repeat protein [Gemmatimonadota bacterium]